jgi:predicted acyltransferase
MASTQERDAAALVSPPPRVEPVAEPQPRPAPKPEAKGDFLQQRLHSLDAYRGIIMVALAFNGFGLAATARNHLRGDPASPFWQTVYHQFEHVEWVGCGFWDLIQPSFMFMVGVAAAFSFAKRQQTGQSQERLFGHVVWRSLALVALGIFLISNWGPSTSWSLMNVLTQIGLAYPALYLLWGRSFRVQAIAAGVLLLGTWMLYMLYPAAGVDLAAGAPDVGVSAAWAKDNLTGLASPWHKNANIGHAIDLWVLNLPLGLWSAFAWTAQRVLPSETALWLLNTLPAPPRFVFNSGGYQSINFVPSLATMLFGLMCGGLLRTPRSGGQKLLMLVAAGVGGVLVGQALNLTGVCPLVKRIWTPSWALFSTGWCCLILAALYGVVDVFGWRRWTWPLTVVGVNSIAIYCMSMLLKPWVSHTFQVHLGSRIFQVLGPLNEPLVQSVTVGVVFWLGCLWLYRNKIFLRI